MHRPVRVQAGLSQVFVARQPVQDRNRRIFGYALRCRSAISSASRENGDAAAGRAMIDHLLGIGFDTLTGGRRAFVRLDRAALLDGVPAALPGQRVVIELGCEIEVDGEVLAACHELRQAGYAISLDDFALNDRTDRLVPLANYLKIDASPGTPPEARARLVACLTPVGASLVAKNIETFDKFEEALKDGFTYVQGFSLGRPVAGARGAATGPAANLTLLRALQNPGLSVRQVDELVRHDEALCFRILRTINSAAFGLQTSVHSILEALVLLGTDPVRRWASLWVIAGLSESTHSELVVMSAVRARCCEVIAKTIGGEDAAAEGFLLGMCSLLDVITGRSMSQVLNELPLDKDVQAALRGQNNWKRRVLDCVIAYERGDWDRAFDLASQTAVDRALLPLAYADALRWSRELLEI